MTPCTLAVDVGGSAVKMGYSTPDGRVHGIRSVSVAAIKSRGDVVTGIIDEIQSALVSAPEHLSPVSVGLVVPGNVDEAAGVGRLSLILGWRDVPFVTLVSEATNLPVGFGHDVCAGATAEGRLGAARGHTDWLFIALGTGLGSAFMLSGRHYRGSNGYGGELSHVITIEDGPLCRCGKRGCLEMLASASAISARYTQAAQEPEPVTAAEVGQRLRQGDQLAAKVWSEAVAALATVVAGYCESMNPSAVVVGGGVAESGDLLFQPLRAQLDGRIRYADVPVIHPAALGQLAGLHGAALLGLEAAGADIQLQGQTSSQVRVTEGDSR